MNKELSILLASVRAAGDAILQLQRDGFAVSRKQNNDLLTEADVLANRMIKDDLNQHFPDVGWLSEESADHPDRLSAARVFVVDPIDGTIEYAKGIPEYAISVALVAHGIPQLAVVYNPATNELFYAEQGQGAWLNGERMHCDEMHIDKLTLLASRSEEKRGEWDRFKADHHVKIVGSIAYKLALVAAGKAHATFSLGPKNEWDIAAGVLLVTEAGGVVTTKHGDAFMFNQRNTLVDSIVASSTFIRPRLIQLIS